MTTEKFTWVKTHKDLIQFLIKNEHSQKKIIELLKSVGIGPFNDKSNQDGYNIELDEIDPFTFFCYIYKYGPEKRLDYLKKIAEKLKINFPNDDIGIPSSNAQRLWLFPFKYERVNNEIKRLWNFFKKAINNDIKNEDFSDILLIRNVAKTKLTEALFNINPDKYFPINGPAKPFIKEFLGIDPEFNTYTEYLSLLEKIKLKISIPFYELSYEAWKWNDQKSNLNYWIFQGNPKVFDFETALKKEILTDWTVSAHKDKIKVGDKIILWITGNKAGCYALAEVTSEPHTKKPSPNDHLWKNEDKSNIKAGIKITHNWVDNPILKTTVNELEELNTLNVGNQGTNFSATKEQYDTIMEIAKTNNEKKYWIYTPGEKASKWEDFYDSGIMAIGWDKIGDLRKLNSKEKIKSALIKAYRGNENKMNDVVANNDFLNNINIGDVVIVKKGIKQLLGYGIVASDYYFDLTRKEYRSCRKVEWKLKGNWKVDFNLVLKTLTDITIYASGVPEYDTYYNRLLGIMTNSKNEKNVKNSLSLNTIIYGPPGTGKTYSLKNEYMKHFTSTENAVTKEDYLSDIIQHCSWWQVIALALRKLGKSKVADIYSHEYVVFKLRFSSSKTVTQTIWGQLLSHTIEESETVKVAKRQPPLIFNKSENSFWEILDDQIMDQAPEIIELEKNINNFSSVSNKEIKRYEFVTFHQSYSYEDFIEGIKPELSETDVAYKIEEGVFQKMCNRARNDKANNYAIFIDEINRGNISSIFGELITLIEDDKREGQPNEIKATLPYSQKQFSVPYNLYIIGTMNTADRSVEALDTALRRRFSFIELNPNPEILSASNYACAGIDLSKLLTAINARVEKLLDKDYCVGHSYFMSIKDKANPLSEIRTIFQNKILPLLQEYFYGDWGKIMLVLGDGFVEKKSSIISFLSTNKYENLEDFEQKPIYKFTNAESWTLNTFRAIYE